MKLLAECAWTAARPVRTGSVAALVLLAVSGCGSSEADAGSTPPAVAGATGTGGRSGSGNVPMSGAAGSAVSGAAGALSAIGGAGGSSPGAAGSVAGTSAAGSVAGSSVGGAGGSSAGGAAAGGTTAGGSTAAGGGGASGGVPPSGGSGGAPAGAGAGGTAGPGAEVTPCATNLLAKCSGTPLACHFGGNPGNYEVKVQLGGPGHTDVEVEAYRRMLTKATTAGTMQWFSFVANVRVYEGEPVRPDQSGTSKGIAGLDVYFRGTDPKPLAVCYEPIAKPLMVWLVGDSTVTDQQVLPYAGWGQHLPAHFVSPVSVANYADSGESSGSALANAKLFPHVRSNIAKGDFVMVQMGHNDDNETAYRANILKIVQDTKAAGGNPILVTPIARARGTLAEQHGNMPQIVRDIGRAESVPVIDLTVTTWNWLQTITWPDYFANGTDATHPNHRGALIIAGFVATAVKTQVPELAKYLRSP